MRPGLRPAAWSWDAASIALGYLGFEWWDRPEFVARFVDEFARTRDRRRVVPVRGTVIRAPALDEGALDLIDGVSATGVAFTDSALDCVVHFVVLGVERRRELRAVAPLTGG